MTETKLNLALIGKARCGKSTTGNAILNKKVFTASSSSGSVTRIVDYSSCQFGQYLLQVVDAPRIFDPEMDSGKSDTENIANMKTVLDICFGGVDAFLLVLQFPCHITLEDRLMLKTLKKIFGDRFFSHVIVVVLTYGDLFEDAMKDEGCTDSFEEWCGKQVGEFRQLYDDCEGRFVLFNNFSKDEDKNRADRQKLTDLAHRLQTDHGRYVFENFRKAQSECETAVQQKNPPDLDKTKPNIKTKRAASQQLRLPQDRPHLSIDKQNTFTAVNQSSQEQDQVAGCRSEISGNKVKMNIHADTNLRNIRSNSEQPMTETSADKDTLQILNRDVCCVLATDIPTDDKTCTDNVKRGVTMVKVKLNFLLVGKARCGKSTTGNTILNKKVFKVSSTSGSATKIVDFGSCQFGEYLLQVVDTPRIIDPEMDCDTSEAVSVTNMASAVRICGGGVDAFLLILQFPCHLTSEDRLMLKTLKKIFGDKFFSHVIVVVLTYGDLFEATMKDEGCSDSFEEWCGKQEGEFRQLYEDCKGRFVLFDNIWNDQDMKLKQLDMLVRLAHILQTDHGRYTVADFKSAKISHGLYMAEASKSVEVDHGRCTADDFESVQTTFTTSTERHKQSTLEKQKHTFKTPPVLSPQSHSRQTQMRVNINTQTDFSLLDQSAQKQDPNTRCMSQTIVPPEKAYKLITEINTKTKKPDHDNKYLPNMPCESEQDETNTSKLCDNQFRHKRHQDTDGGLVKDMPTTDLTLIDKIQHKTEIQPKTQVQPKSQIQLKTQIQPKSQIADLKFILIGKQGYGKSSTGNTLLNRPAFNLAARTKSETREIDFGVSMFENYRLTVVDGICLDDVVKDTGEVETNMEVALGHCSGYVDAFLLVLKFGHPFTVRDRSILDALKQILGAYYLDHVIIMVTGGDMFERFMDEKECRDIFGFWCMEQNDESFGLYTTCKGRVLLFNNWGKDEKIKQMQIQQLINSAHDLCTIHGQYSDKFFKYAVKQGKTSTPLQNVSTDTLDIICNKLRRLLEASESVSQTRSDNDANKIQAMIHDLKRDLQDQDKDSKFVKYIMTEIDKIEDKLRKNNKVKEVKLNFLLMGKTGQGKSDTGNTILNRRVFKISANMTSQTKKVKSSFAQFGRYILLVVDGPGLQDTDLDKVKDREAAAKNMGRALTMCYGGVDAFLFVMKFGHKFTDEDRATLETLKRIFGDKFFDHVIIVVTCGDQFEKAMKREGRYISFTDWCSEQSGEFSQLYNDCGRRAVLFDNDESDKGKQFAMVNEIVKLAHGLQTRNGRYTSDIFIAASIQLEKVIVEQKALEISRELQEKMCLLSAEIEALPVKALERDKTKIALRIQDLKNEIEVQDRGSGVLMNLMMEVEGMEANLDDTIELKRRAQTLDRIRKAKNVWVGLGSVWSIIIKCATLANPLIGTIAGGVCQGISFVGGAIMTGLEEYNLAKHGEIESKLAIKNRQHISRNS